MMKKLFAAALMALAVSLPAQANYTNVWSYSGGQGLTAVTASGTFETVGNASTPELVVSATGQRNGYNISGPVALGTDAGFLYDNLLQLTFPQTSWYGVLFDVAGFTHTNLYSDNGVMHETYWVGGFGSVGAYVVDNIVEFSIHQVPEPGSLALLGLALVIVFGVAKANKNNNNRRYVASAIA